MIRPSLWSLRICSRHSQVAVTAWRAWTLRIDQRSSARGIDRGQSWRTSETYHGTLYKGSLSSAYNTYLRALGLVSDVRCGGICRAYILRRVSARVYTLRSNLRLPVVLFRLYLGPKTCSFPVSLQTPPSPLNLWAQTHCNLLPKSFSPRSTLSTHPPLSMGLHQHSDPHSTNAPR